MARQIDDTTVRYHRTEDTDEFTRLTDAVPQFEYELTEVRTTAHFHDERHDDKYLPDGWKSTHTNRLGADGGIQVPERVAVEGREVELTYDSLGGKEVDTGEVFEVEYNTDAEHITRLAVRAHYSHAIGQADVDGFDVVHVLDLTGGSVSHVTCWLNRKEDNYNRNGDTGE